MNTSRLSPFLSKKEWLILGLLFAYSFIPVVGSLLRLWEIAGGPTIAPENPRVNANPLPAVVHLISIIIYCYLGAFQFMPSIRLHRARWHHINGRIVVSAGVLSAVSGAWMTHYYTFSADLQGAPLYYFRLIISAAMLLFIVLGVMAIVRKNITSHRRWMIRAYAVALGASTQTFLGLSWLLVAGSEVVGTQRDILMISAWMINLVVAEHLIGKQQLFFKPKTQPL